MPNAKPKPVIAQVITVKGKASHTDILRRVKQDKKLREYLGIAYLGEPSQIRKRNEMHTYKSQPLRGSLNAAKAGGQRRGDAGRPHLGALYEHPRKWMDFK